MGLGKRVNLQASNLLRFYLAKQLEFYRTCKISLYKNKYLFVKKYISNISDIYVHNILIEISDLYIWRVSMWLHNQFDYLGE